MVKLLLVGVFKPFGVDSEYGEALNTMELLNNQVTREQGIHSPRSNNPSFGLYMLAENIDVQTTVLDFPSWTAFTKEIDGGNYTHVGISFITPNVLQAK
ncbi:MAG: radical SAM protein, partial [Nitrospinota bacterium]